MSREIPSPPEIRFKIEFENYEDTMSLESTKIRNLHYSEKQIQKVYRPLNRKIRYSSIFLLSEYTLFILIRFKKKKKKLRKHDLLSLLIK